MLKVAVIDDEKITLAPLQAGGTISLRIYTKLESNIKDIPIIKIPMVERIFDGDKQALRVSDAGTNLISIKEVQRKIQNEYDEIKARGLTYSFDRETVNKSV